MQNWKSGPLMCIYPASNVKSMSSYFPLLSTERFHRNRWSFRCLAPDRDALSLIIKGWFQGWDRHFHHTVAFSVAVIIPFDARYQDSTGGSRRPFSHLNSFLCPTVRNGLHQLGLTFTSPISSDKAWLLRTRPISPTARPTGFHQSLKIKI